jgi:hypothetical protein
MRETFLKLAALLSYCGGPLFVADLLKPRFGMGPAVFLATFLPIGMMLMGAFYVDDRDGSGVTAAFVRLGVLGLVITLGMHVYALGCFVQGLRVPDQGLHDVGIAVGVPWSVVYLRAARRWEAGVASTRSPDHTSSDPIEPS